MHVFLSLSLCVCVCVCVCVYLDAHLCAHGYTTQRGNGEPLQFVVERPRGLSESVRVRVEVRVRSSQKKKCVDGWHASATRIKNANGWCERGMGQQVLRCERDAHLVNVMMFVCHDAWIW